MLSCTLTHVCQITTCIHFLPSLMFFFSKKRKQSASWPSGKQDLKMSFFKFMQLNFQQPFQYNKQLYVALYVELGDVERHRSCNFHSFLFQDRDYSQIEIFHSTPNLNTYADSDVSAQVQYAILCTFLQFS